MTTPALRIAGLTKRYRRAWGTHRPAVAALDGVDLRVDPGEVVGLIGESGSGKTTLARAALALVGSQGGEIEVLGQDPRTLRGEALRHLRSRAQLLFQNPDASLNPGLRVGEIVEDSARLHRPGEDPAVLRAEALGRVGLAHRARAWPHELSGGEKRRVGIAQVALARPSLIVADEPTSGLDAGLKADLIDLLRPSPGDRTALLLISHDLALVAYAADRVAVMLAGRIVEEFPAPSLLRGPHHPYTWSLLAAAGLGPPTELRPVPMEGRGCVGCPFRGPCASERPACTATRPPLTPVGPAHAVACHAVEPA